MNPPEKCLKDQCRSPVACNGFGYCRERNFRHEREAVPAPQQIQEFPATGSGAPAGLMAAQRRRAPWVSD